MDRFTLLTVLQMLSLNEAYNFQCPSPAHWNLRANSTCKPPRNYTCLFDVTYRVNIYRDKCNRPRILGPGYKYVFQPNLNRAECSRNRYQPFIFETVGYSDCTYQKSLCNSLGQKTYNNGGTTIDRKCVCNTDRGYTFIRNSNNQYYCNPSTDDCSCYLGINPYNITVGLKDIKRYEDMKMTSIPFLVDRFNKSQTTKVIKFDNYKYNINYVSTNEYRTKSAITVLTLLFVYLAVCIFVYTFLPRWIQFRKKIKKQKLDYGIAAIKDRKEERRYVRIQVIGKEGVGKSSLVRRLVGDSNMKVDSTDGIDIVKKCQIRTTDGKWVIGKVETERNKIMKRIQEAIRKEQRQSEPVDSQAIPCKRENNENEPITSNESLSEVGGKQAKQSRAKDKIGIASLGSNTAEQSLTGEIKMNIGDNVTVVEEKSEIDIPYENDGDLSRDIQKAEDLVNTEDMRKKITEQMDEILVKVKKDQDRMTTESLVECGLWDFAGQKDYYATHQTFLNPHAIYLLVTNISEDIAATEDNKNFDSIEEFIDFWFDSIHCLSTRSSGNDLYPPVIVVCTHIDEFKTEKEVEERKTKYIKTFRNIFGDQDKVNHKRGIFFISNTNFHKGDIKKLKDKISDIAKEMKFFAENLPTQWIKLENALNVLKDSGQNILSWQNIVELAQITLTEVKELLPFLTYQNKIGNIIFFQDIKEYIILRPDWLVKCFRCLVCDNHPLKRNIDIVELTDWDNLEETGQLSDSIIDKLFEKEPTLEFGKYKTHILNVMEKFDIIVRPQLIAVNNDPSPIPNSYYMPCMIIKQSTYLDIIQKSFKGEECKFIFSPWLILEFTFLPLAYFNHILFYYIRTYPVCEENNGQKTIYRGKALVNLDKTGFRKLCICFSKNVIALQVWTLAGVEYNRYDTILEELCRKIEELKRKLSQNISYNIKAKCRNGDYSNKHGRITYKELGEICEQGRYYCREHTATHSKDDVEKTWLQHADMIMAILNTEQAENNPRNSIENKPIKEETFTHDQTSVKNNLPVAVTLRKQINIKNSKNESQFITSCIKTGNTLVFTDRYNNRLIICNSDGGDIHHIPLSYKPYYITEIDSNTVAVACVDRTIMIINISTRSITSIIKTSDICSGISYNDNNLYVVIDWSIIHVMDLTGKVIRTIPLPTNRIYDITVDRDRLVCVDTTSIYCCSLDGKVMWKFKKDAFQDLTRVTTDNEGNVYVTNASTHIVLVVSDDGKHHRELLTESDGLDKPIGIYFDKKENVLLVCNERDGNAFLFDVIKKLT